MIVEKDVKKKVAFNTFVKKLKTIKILSIDPAGEYGKGGYGTTGLAFIEVKNDDSFIQSEHCKVWDVDARDYNSQGEYWEAIMKFVRDMDYDIISVEAYKIQKEGNGMSDADTPKLIEYIQRSKKTGSHWVSLMAGITSGSGTIKYGDTLLVKKGIITKSKGRFLLNGKGTNDHMRRALGHALYPLVQWLENKQCGERILPVIEEI